MSDFRLIHGEAVRSMIRLRREGVQVDAVVCDPPYELGFMGKRWDRAGVSYRPRTWRAAHCLLPEGGRLLGFGGTRTHHRIWCAIEDAGFAIEDTVSWLYGSGFPKHRSKLKPAWEPVVVARKGGVSELNIDAGRVAMSQEDANFIRKTARPNTAGQRHEGAVMNRPPNPTVNVHAAGRWPANVALSHHEECERVGTRRIKGHSIGSRGAGGRHGRYGPIGAQQGHDHTDADGMETVEAWACHPDCAVRLLDEQSGERGGAAPASGPTYSGYHKSGSMAGAMLGRGDTPATFHNDSGGASRFYYIAKADRAERERGLEGLDRKPGPSGEYGTKAVNLTRKDQGPNEVRPVLNHHPTVKPVDLMRWLIRLVAKPGETVLDPFMGSGTTGIACTLEGVHFIGIEREPEYVEIARRRIANTQPSLFADGAA